MARVTTKPGLIENAGGWLVCPVCRSDRLYPEECLWTTDTQTVAHGFGPGNTLVTPRMAPDPQATVAEFTLRCAQRHTVTVVLEAPRVGGARVTTEWIVPDGDAE
jgi:hypothetical protein